MHKASRPPNNHYHQMTNLAIDLQSQVSRSLILPKIAQRQQRHLYHQLAKNTQTQEERTLEHLQAEVNRLQRQMLRLQNQKYIWHRLKTEGHIQQAECLCRGERIGLKQSTGSQHFESPSQYRNSEDDGNSRVQRNTEKQTRVEKISISRPSINNSTLIDKQNTGLSNIPHLPSKVTVQLDREKSMVKKKPKMRNNNPAVRARFRKCVYAVYFCLLLPSLGRKIYQNRLKHFIREYPHEVSKYYLSRKEGTGSQFRSDEAALWEEMKSKMDIMEVVADAQLVNLIKEGSQVRQVKVHFQSILNEEQQPETKIKKQSFSALQQLMHPRNIEHILEKLISIVGDMTDQFTRQITSKGFFSRNYMTFAQNILHGSFVNNSRPKLLARVIASGCAKMHPNKEYLCVQGRDAQITLLTFDIFCRVYCYRWMNQLQKDQLTQKYSQNQLLIANLLLAVIYLAGQSMIDDVIKDIVRTNRRLPEKSKWQPRKIRPIIPLSVKKKYKGLNAQTNRLIIDVPYLEEASAIVMEHREVVNKIKARLVNVGAELYAELGKKMEEERRRVLDETLMEKGIVSGDRYRPQSLWGYQLEPVDQGSKVAVGSNFSQEKSLYSRCDSQKVNKSSISIMVRRPQQS